MKAHTAPYPTQDLAANGPGDSSPAELFQGKCYEFQNKLWAVLAIKSIDMNTSSVFIFGLKSPQPWKAKLEKKKSSSHRTGSLGSWEL